MKSQVPAPERIILNIPYYYKNIEHDDNKYYPINHEIQEAVQINLIKKDLGPLTKLAPTLKLIPEDEDVYIITIDDDILYMPHTLELYERMNPLLKIKSAMGLSGFVYEGKTIVPKFGVHNVQVIEGYGSVCYHRSFFKGGWDSYVDICLKDKNLFLSDDLIISNWLALQKINRLQVAAPWVNRKLMWDTGCILEYGASPDALHKQEGGNEKRYEKALNYLAKIKLLDKVEYGC